MPELYGPPSTIPMPRFSQSGRKLFSALLIEQGVAAGQQEAVEIAGLGEVAGRLPTR